MKWGIRRKRPELYDGSRPTYARKTTPQSVQYTRKQIKQMQNERNKLMIERSKMDKIKKDPGYIDTKDSLVDDKTMNNIKKGFATANSVLSIAGMAANTYNAAAKVAQVTAPIVKPIVNKGLDSIGNLAVSDLNKGLNNFRVD